MIKTSIFLSFFCLFSLSAGWGKIKTIRESLRKSDFKKSWVISDEKSDINRLLFLLEKTVSGRAIVKKSRLKAKERGHKLTDLIHRGDKSLTDTTLVRRFNAQTPNIVRYENRSIVYINDQLNLKDALLDLAHELTHFSMREAFNPYRDNFSLGDFIKSTVEGRGGEVEAYLTECQVFYELFRKFEGVNDKCQLVVAERSGHLSLKEGKKQFYKLGAFYDKFKEHIRKHDIKTQEFHEMSSDEALFISSAYGLPYPLAAVLEYESIMSRVCQNDEKRLRYVASQRKPASLGAYDLKLHKHRKRCAKFTRSSI